MENKQPNRIYKDFDLSFTTHPTTGDIGRKVDVNAIKQSLYGLFLTNFYERPFQPDLGSPIASLLFEPMDHIITQAISQGIERLIFNFEPRVKLLGVDVLPNYDENQYDITIKFNMIGVGQPVTFSTVLKRIR